MKFIILMFMFSSARAEMVYRATTEIGNHQFQDIIIINELPFQGGGLTGSLTVPGIFSTNFLESSDLRVYLWSDHYQMNLDVNVNENNQTSLLHYRLKSKNTGYKEMEGQLLNEANETVGIVKEMRLIYESRP